MYPDFALQILIVCQQPIIRRICLDHTADRKATEFERIHLVCSQWRFSVGQLQLDSSRQAAMHGQASFRIAQHSWTNCRRPARRQVSTMASEVKRYASARYPEFGPSHNH